MHIQYHCATQVGFASIYDCDQSQPRVNTPTSFSRPSKVPLRFTDKKFQFALSILRCPHLVAMQMLVQISLPQKKPKFV